jgi:putrescine transport system substrate-binding protein
VRTATRSGFLFAAVILLPACGGGQGKAGVPAVASEEKVLNVYNWPDNIAETTIADFEAKTGIKVIYDVYDSNEILETKLLTGHTGYDVVVPSLTFLEREIKAGVFLKLDNSKLPNLANMNPEIMRLIAAGDPGNEHAINYLWGTTGIGYNPKLVEKVLGTRTIDSWRAVFDPAIASKLAKCGIAIVDDPGDVLAAARIYLGLDQNENVEDLAATEELLTKVRPYVRYFNSSQYVNDLAAGEICVSLGWSGGVLLARSRGAEAETPVEVAYTIPGEGANIWFDMLAIPADAPHPGNAHAFLNFLMEPDIIAAVSDHVGYANGNEASLPYMKDELRNDSSVYPADEIFKKLEPIKAMSSEYSRDLNRAWTRIKTGQ